MRRSLKIAKQACQSLVFTCTGLNKTDSEDSKRSYCTFFWSPRSTMRCKLFAHDLAHEIRSYRFLRKP